MRRLHASLPLLALSLAWASSTGSFEFVERIQGTPMDMPVFSGDSLKRYILDVNGNGCVWFDYNNDGWMDLFITHGSTIEGLRGAPRRSRSNRLFANLGGGRFRDVTSETGVGGPASAWSMGAVAGDFDNDGWTDLFVTCFGPDLLYRNTGNGRFTEVAREAGLTLLDGWSTGATFGDYDGDGDLDLYVAAYVQFDAQNPPAPECAYQGLQVMCGPAGLRPAPDFLFRNRGDGTFEDVTSNALLGGHLFDSYGFSAVFVDLNGDRRLDLYVANDLNANLLYRNNGNGTFSEIGLASGAAYGEGGRAQASMGIAVGDYNRDGRPDLLATHFSDDYDTLYRNEGDFLFSDVSRETGIYDVSLPYLGWAAIFADFDRDGWEDLFVANGHVYPQVATQGRNYLQRNLLYRNREGRRFEPTSESLAAVQAEGLNRGGAVGDFDNDGDLDLMIVRMDAVPSLLENRSEPGNGWLGLSLERPFGAEVKLVTTAGEQYRYPVSGGSYLSQNDPRVVFGLGRETRPIRVEIRWPGGRTSVLDRPAPNQYHPVAFPAGIE